MYKTKRIIRLFVPWFCVLTSQMKLLDWLSAGGLLVLVVRDGGVLEHKPVLFVWPQTQSFGPERTHTYIHVIKIMWLMKNKRWLFLLK